MSKKQKTLKNKKSCEQKTVKETDKTVINKNKFEKKKHVKQKMSKEVTKLS